MPQHAASVTPITHLTTDQDPVFLGVCELLSPFNRNSIALLRETNIINDIEVDSVAIFDLVMEIEDAYEITFPMETIADMKTIGDLVTTINAAIIS